MEPGRELDTAAIEARLRPYIARLSCVVLVALRWDEKRAALRDWVHAQGVGCRVLVLGDGGEVPALPADLRRVTAHEITHGQGLSL